MAIRCIILAPIRLAINFHSVECNGYKEAWPMKQIMYMIFVVLVCPWQLGALVQGTFCIHLATGLVMQSK